MTIYKAAAVVAVDAVNTLNAEFTIDATAAAY
jgi:hypothetical protein